MKSPLIVAAAAAVSVLSLAACSPEDSNDGDPTSSSSSANEAGDHNAADVEFAQEMIPHHAQALRMVVMTEHRNGLDPAFRELTEDIRAAQAPEIDSMTQWLQTWGEDVPDIPERYGGGHGSGGMDMHSGMPGMMGEEDFDALDGAGSSTFENMWLQMMIEHHEGAIEMAQEEQEGGEYPPAIELAEQIEKDQEREIQTMRQQLDS